MIKQAIRDGGSGASQRLALLALAGTLGLVGCSREQAPATAAGPVSAPDRRTYPYAVVATVGMVADIVREVAGDKATVAGIIGTGVDPHLYKPTRNDVAALLAADIVFYSGLMLEGKMADTLVRVAQKRPVRAVTELVEESFLLEPTQMAGHYDPHLWMDVNGWMQGVTAVATALGEFDPLNRETYDANAARYLAELEKLHAYARASIQSIPERSRVLITAHDAFNYFGRAYQIDVEGIQGLSTESEAGLEDIRRLVELIVSRDIQAVFMESSVSEKNVRALIEGARAQGRDVRVGGQLFSDAMGEAGSYEGTYLGMIDHNVTTITRALGGQAPVAGLNGRLRVNNADGVSAGSVAP